MPKPNYRQRAREHVNGAKAELLTPGESGARDACLKLRMAIEALTYETLQAYLAEVPNSVMSQWTPKKVIDELLAVDPNADKTVKLSFGRQEVPGQPAQKMKYLGDDRRFTVKWANKAHNALGSFLHEPTIAQCDRETDGGEALARAKAAEIIAKLDEILSGRLFGVNFGVFIELKCDCGFTVRRKEDHLRAGNPVSCGSCGMQYCYELEEDGTTFKFRPDQIAYTCAQCGIIGYVHAHKLRDLPVIVCDCGAKSKVEIEYVLSQLEPERVPAKV